MKKTLILMLLASAYGLALAQPERTMDFSWVGTASGSTHSTSVTLCEEDVLQMTLTTTSACQQNFTSQGNAISNGHPTTSALVPYPTLGTPLTLTTTIAFTHPVADVWILLRDLDDDVPPVGPEEIFSNFLVNGQSMMPTSITPNAGSYSQLSNSVNPLAANCNGWFRFATGNINSISFDYWRVNDHYAYLLDSIKFTCNSLFVSVEPTRPSFDFQFGPNPAHQYLDLHLPDASPWNATVRDLRGRELLQGKGTTMKARIEVGQLAAGTYFLEIAQGQQRSVQKFIIQD